MHRLSLAFYVFSAAMDLLVPLSFLLSPLPPLSPPSFTMCTLPLLPLELCEGIIDNIQDDIPSLSSCALVCRHWLPRSRYHLFGTVNISSRRHVYRLRDILHGCAPIGELVHSLTLLLAGRRTEPVFFSLPDLTAALLLPLLPNLRCWNLSASPAEAQSLFRFLYRRLDLRLFLTSNRRHGANVERLELDRLMLSSPAEVVQIAQSLPGLRYLRCGGLAFKNTHVEKNGGSLIPGLCVSSLDVSD